MGRIRLGFLLFLLTACVHGELDKLSTDERNQWLLDFSNNTPTVEWKKSPSVLTWWSSQSNWALVSLAEKYSVGRRSLALIDSGASFPAAREDSALAQSIPAEKRLNVPGAGFLAYVPELQIGDVVFKNVAVHFFSKAVPDVEDSKKNPEGCCAMTLGQNIFRAADFKFDRTKKQISILRPAGCKSSHATKIFNAPESLTGGKRVNHWFAKASFAGRQCDLARIDLGDAKSELKVYRPWFSGSSVPKKGQLKFTDKAIDVQPDYYDQPTGYVTESICMNIGAATLFREPFVISVSHQCLSYDL